MSVSRAKNEGSCVRVTGLSLGSWTCTILKAVCHIFFSVPFSIMHTQKLGKEVIRFLVLLGWACKTETEI